MANSVDPDQMLQNVVSDLGLHCLQGQFVPKLRVIRILIQSSSLRLSFLCAPFPFRVDPFPATSKILSPTAQGLYIQLTLVISTPLISILSLMSNWFLRPDCFPYVFIVFQLRVCRTIFMSTLRLSRPSFSVPEYIFHSFYYRVSRTRTMTKEKKK